MPDAADDGFAAWLRLLEAPGLGREAVRRLLTALGTPEAVLDAGPAVWSDLAGPALAHALARPPESFPERLRAARRWLDGGPGRRFIALGDPLYPPMLLQTADPPLLLYVQGRAELLHAASVAVVGSRRATAQGLDHARAFARQLGQAGLVVVSGLAQGIDAAAHEGALAAPAGTVAVVGTGLDIVYPRRHEALAARIGEQGALVSEYTPGTPPMAANFPQRNRIVTGLAQGTLVVEAALRSGSLISARLAAEAGREVYAIPGSIHAEQSRGCHALIRQGAMLVESAQDIIDDLRGTCSPPAPPEPQPEHRPADPLLQALGADPVSLDTLSARTGWGAADLSARLLDLELDGVVQRLPGGLFQRRFGA